VKKYLIYSRYANLAFSLGVTMAVSIFFGYFGGTWLDTRLGTEPVFLIVGLLAGVAVAFKGLFTEITAMQQFIRRLEEEQAAGQNPGKDHRYKDELDDR